jgi:hypothetical protein
MKPSANSSVQGILHAEARTRASDRDQIQAGRLLPVLGAARL